MPPTIITLESRAGTLVAVVRRLVRPTELSRAVRDGCGTVWAGLKAQGLRGGRNIAIYWDDDIRLEAGVEMPEGFAEQEGIVRSSTPAGLVVVVRHLGPYGTLSVAHLAIHGWCEANQHRPLGPRWEIYGHWKAAWDTDPSSIETEVAYLVKPL